MAFNRHRFLGSGECGTKRRSPTARSVSMPVLDSALTRTPAQSSAVLKTEIPTKSVLLQQKSESVSPMVAFSL